jgi:hypothetical protein
VEIAFGAIIGAPFMLADGAGLVAVMVVVALLPLPGLALALALPATPPPQQRGRQAATMC